MRPNSIGDKKERERWDVVFTAFVFLLNAFIIKRHVFQCHSWNGYGQSLVPLNINNTQTDTERERRERRESLIVNFIRIRREMSWEREGYSRSQ